MSDTAELRRVAVVTGGSRGIGRAVCLQLARQGCCVVVNYCHGAQAAAETADLCRQAGAEALTVQADVSTAEGCAELFRQAAEQFVRVDILVNNAGITRDGLLLRMSEQDFDQVMDANLKGHSSAAKKLPAGWFASAMAASSTLPVWWPCVATPARPTTPPARRG